MESYAGTDFRRMALQVQQADPDWDRAARIAREIAEQHMSPKGALGLPPLLDERRLKYGIPDEAFAEHAVFDRVYVHQIEPAFQEGKNTYGNTSIILPENKKEKSKKESSRGVLVSAGLGALDKLRSNGIDLGHIVNMVRLYPWSKLVGMTKSGHEMHVMVLIAGDIVGSEDMETMRRAGKARIEWDAPTNQHHWVDGDGQRWVPQTPYVDDSM